MSLRKHAIYGHMWAVKRKYEKPLPMWGRQESELKQLLDILACVGAEKGGVSATTPHTRNARHRVLVCTPYVIYGSNEN